MTSHDLLTQIALENKGVLKTSTAIEAGVSKPTLLKYVENNGFERIAHGIYLSPDAWNDGMYLLQSRFAQAILSHETAAFLHNLVDREPFQYTVTVKTGYNATTLLMQNVRVHKIKKDLYELGLSELLSPAGHPVRVYNPERTVCDLLRSRSKIEIQDLQAVLRAYVRTKQKNIPLLMRYARDLRVEKVLKPYLEVLL